MIASKPPLFTAASLSKMLTITVNGGGLLSERL